MNRSLQSPVPPARQPVAMVLGTNEIASAVAVHLKRGGYAVVLSHDPFPPVIRRAMAFHDALYGDPAVLALLHGQLAETGPELSVVSARPDCVAVSPLLLNDLLAWRMPQVLIDARLQKNRVTPDLRGIARLTVGLGPNFAVGRNCDVAIETRPKKAGDIVVRGRTDEPDGVPPALGGVGKERFAYATTDGLWHTPIEIGMRVYKNVIVGTLGSVAVRAPIDGHVRGIVRDSLTVEAGGKLLEIDPRGRNAVWTGMDGRGRTIARATMKAIRLRTAQRASRGNGSKEVVDG
ncbi:xanthine dehydrogenase [Methyloceanibacter sp. wino2]|uniref:xanthine dehydrogenase n=1 Tax=Methyloceanibacter sp. wino2 TaxID=2170729 RepID=UPI000D3E4941|nr:xanthine dehydrogenase [Methyloceanibacter sp. wino2]